MLSFAGMRTDPPRPSGLYALGMQYSFVPDCTAVATVAPRDAKDSFGFGLETITGCINSLDYIPGTEI